jgi:DNA repair photolyase
VQDRPPSDASAPPAHTIRPRGRLVARGAATNPGNRFDRIHVVEDPELCDPLEPDELDDHPVATHYYADPSREIVARNQSPDVGFDASVNPYRGCSHSCSYCYARPTHEYLGFSAGLDFETKILVKQAAPALLRKALASPRWQPEVIALSGVTDPYQPIERKLRITRGCLEVLAEFRNPVVIVTKGALVERDADLLSELARHSAAAVNVSVTSLDDSLRRRLEPRASSPRRRLGAISALARAGVPVSVMVAPVIPGLNDAEIPAIVAAAAEAGARGAHMVMLRLPHAVGPLFEDWLERNAPERRQRVMNRVREMRGGRTNDPRFHTRIRGEGNYAQQIHDLFALACRRAGLSNERAVLSTASFRRPSGPQLEMFTG